MNTDTYNKDHWVLDREHSDRNSNSKLNELLLDAIISQIENRNNTFLDEDTVPEIHNNKAIFSLPDLYPNTTPPRYKNYICNSQDWVCHVTGIYENSFEAKLVDKNDDSTFEIAEFDFDEISNGDLKLLKVGAIFYWSVGYASQNGQITKQSLLRFKRSAPLSNNEFNTIFDKASEMSEQIIWD
jgi:hypothetical protein